MLVIKYTRGYKHHLVDTETGLARCGRDGSGWYSFWSSGYKVTWGIEGGHRHCTQCGTPEEFQAVSDADVETHRKMEAERDAARNRARALAKDKAAVLRDELWPAVREALADVGLDVWEMEPKGILDRGGTLVVRAEAGDHTFWFKVAPPSTSYGVTLCPPFPVNESTPHWAEPREVA